MHRFAKLDLVKMKETEILMIEASNKEEALYFALDRKNVIDYPQHEQEDWDRIDLFVKDIKVEEKRDENI